jgi:hypothetical protein
VMLIGDLRWPLTLIMAGFYKLPAAPGFRFGKKPPHTRRRQQQVSPIRAVGVARGQGGSVGQPASPV